MLCAKAIFVSFLLVMTSPVAYGLDYSYNGDVTLFRGLRVLREKNASEYLSVDDSEGIFGLGVKFEVPSFVLDLKGRLITAYSPGLSIDPSDPANLDINPPSRYFNWGRQLTKETEFQSFSDVEKAYLLYQQGSFEFSVGRRAVGIGTLKYVPIWNRFIPSIAHVGGAALINNPDDIQFSYQFRKVAISGIHIQGATAEDNISVLVSTWYLKWIEVHALAGNWWTRRTVGLAFVKDFEGISIRGEGLFFQDQINPDDIQQQLGLGLEYAFSSKFSFLMEAIYSSIGASSTAGYLVIPRDKFAILNADGYVFGMLEYLPFAFWTVSVGSLVNLVDTSSLVIGEVKYSWSDNLDISLQLKQPIGSNGEEFGSDFYSVAEDVNFGYSQQFAIQLKYYF